MCGAAPTLPGTPGRNGATEFRALTAQAEMTGRARPVPDMHEVPLYEGHEAGPVLPAASEGDLVRARRACANRSAARRRGEAEGQEHSTGQSPHRAMMKLRRSIQGQAAYGSGSGTALRGIRPVLGIVPTTGARVDPRARCLDHQRVELNFGQRLWRRREKAPFPALKSPPSTA